jgi:hypothetical protein
MIDKRKQEAGNADKPKIEELEVNAETVLDLPEDLKAEEQEQVKGGVIKKPNGSTKCTNGYCQCAP